MKTISLVGVFVLFLVGSAHAKDVLLPYDAFLEIIAIKEHAEKLKAKALAENGVLLKLKDEQGSIINIQADQIRACENLVKSHEQLGATEAQLSQVIQAELTKEKRLGRYKSELIGVGAVVMGVILWIVN